MTRSMPGILKIVGKVDQRFEKRREQAVPVPAGGRFNTPGNKITGIFKDLEIFGDDPFNFQRDRHQHLRPYR